MWMVEIMGYKPWIQVKKVKNAEEAEFESRNDSDYIVLTNNQFKEALDGLQDDVEQIKKEITNGV